VPTWRTVSRSVRAWTPAGRWESVPAARRRNGHIRGGRDPAPRVCLLDRPSLTTRSVRGEARGSEGRHTQRHSCQVTQNIPTEQRQEKSIPFAEVHASPLSVFLPRGSLRRDPRDAQRVGASATLAPQACSRRKTTILLPS